MFVGATWGGTLGHLQMSEELTRTNVRVFIFTLFYEISNTLFFAILKRFKAL